MELQHPKFENRRLGLIVSRFLNKIFNGNLSSYLTEILGDKPYVEEMWQLLSVLTSLWVSNHGTLEERSWQLETLISKLFKHD